MAEWTSLIINRYVSELLECGGDDGKGLSSRSGAGNLIMMKSVFAYGETGIQAR
ncbi:MAG: hypothetical protein ACLVIP_04435 [Ruminococcus sp.]